MQFVVDGWPRPSGRARTVHRGNKTWSYMPKAGIEWCRTVTAALMAQYDGEPIVDDVAVTVLFHGASKSADIDNLLKPIFDALQKAGVIKNDKQIVELHTYKYVDVKKRGIVIYVNEELKLK